MAKRTKKNSTAAAQTPVDSNIPSEHGTTPLPPTTSEAPLSENSRETKGESWTARTQSDVSSKGESDRRPAYPNPNVPFSIAHNNQAGLRLLKFDRFKQVQLAFSSPVSGDIEGQLVAASWKYRPEEKVYTKQYGEKGTGVAIEEARRFYNELVDQLLTSVGDSREFSRPRGSRTV